VLRTAATIALAALTAVPGVAAAAAPCVFAQPGYELEDVARGGGAVGLVVPDAGPTTSERRARTWLSRGVVENSLLGDPAVGAARIGIDCKGRRVVAGVPSGGRQPNDRRYAIVDRRAPSGVLTSDTTRIPGLVSITDVARDRLASTPHEDALTYLGELDRRITENGRSRAPAAVGVAVVLAALALANPLAAVLGFVTVLAANLVLGAVGVSDPPLVASVLVGATLAALPLARFLASPLALAAACAGVVAAYGAAMAVDATWVALSPLGPTQNGRFYGLSNLLTTLLLVPALAAAALAVPRVGWWAFVGIGTVAFAVVASSRLGADGGGALALAAGYCVLAAALLPRGRRLRAAAVAFAGAAVVVAAAVAVGPATHVTETIGGGPAQVAAELGERVELSWLRASDRWETALAVGGSLAVLGVLVARGPRPPLAIAFAAATAVSLVVNDSPREVAVGGLLGYLALTRLSHSAISRRPAAPAPPPAARRGPAPRRFRSATSR
jgi:hypothetical protein